MNSKKRLHYIDLRPEPIKPEPSALVIWLGAALALVTVYIVTVVLFSL